MPALEPVTVLVVDDQRPYRVVAAAVLRRVPGFVLVGEASTGEEAVEQVRALRPRLVLMDIRLPGVDGCEATRRVVDVAPGTVVVLCSTYRLEDLPYDVAGCGAAAYVHKEELRPELLRRLWDEHAPPLLTS